MHSVITRGGGTLRTLCHRMLRSGITFALRGAAPSSRSMRGWSILPGRRVDVGDDV